MWIGVAAIMGLATLRAPLDHGGAAIIASRRGRRQCHAPLAGLRRYRELSFDYHRTTPTGELLSHMEADVEAAVDVYYPVPFSVGALFLALFALAALVVADPYLPAVGS